MHVIQSVIMTELGMMSPMKCVARLFATMVRGLHQAWKASEVLGPSDNRRPSSPSIGSSTIYVSTGQNLQDGKRNGIQISQVIHGKALSPRYNSQPPMVNRGTRRVDKANSSPTRKPPSNPSIRYSAVYRIQVILEAKLTLAEDGNEWSYQMQTPLLVCYNANDILEDKSQGLM